MSILDLILGRESGSTGDGVLKRYINSLNIRSDVIRLEGPFLDEQYAIKYLELYKELLRTTYYRVNFQIQRPLALISSDKTLEFKDNDRVKLGIQPYNHTFELYLTLVDFDVIGVDGNILLNKNDCLRAKKVLKKFPITMREEETNNRIKF